MLTEQDRLWTVSEVAHYLGVSVQTIYGWRTRGEGPVGCRVGGKVRYSRDAVEKWLAGQQDARSA